MAGIVKSWITDKLGLEIPHALDAAGFQYEVANGILIAEILRKYSLLSDDEFVSLRHNNHKKSRTANMQHLHKWLVNAGMDLDENLLMDIAKEKHGCAAKFLYELFLWVEHGPRKPKVGDNAKKYLTQHTTVNSETPARERRISRDDRMSVLSSTWLHSLKSQEGEKISESTTVVPKMLKKLPNWYTTLDSSKIYQHSRPDPFNEMSEAAQAETVYFSEEIIETFKKQPVAPKQIKTTIDITPTEKEEQLVNSKLKFKTRDEITKDRKARARLEEELQVLEQIRKFDKKLEQKNTNSTKQQGITNTNIGDRVYVNGKGCKQELANSLNQLKCKREKVEKASTERNKWRKKAMNKIIENIPNSMFENMQADILKLVFALPTNERMLADFIYHEHQDKNLFRDHAYFETIQRQRAKDFDLSKSMQIEQEEKDLKRAVLEYKYEHPPKPSDELDVQEERKESPIPRETLSKSKSYTINNLLVKL